VILSARFEQALTYAAILHSGQLRKGTATPYISHLLMVTGIALEHGADEDEAIAALLHDAVEDAGGKPRLADIRRRFGEPVATIVDGCTDADVIPKPEWSERKRQYVAHVRQEQNPSVLLVSASDKLANMRSILGDYHEIGEALWGRFNGGREGTFWYYRTMANVFIENEQMPSASLAKELACAVSDLETLAARAELTPAAVLQPSNWIEGDEP
jgi:(p)ppGpp synthase/HD superfamily hydrolase